MGTLCRLIADIFRNPLQVSEVNGTFITLIPKLDQVSNIKDFRPISLCNVSYKIVTKILAQRLRPVMSKLVNPCQSSFIPNRQSRDNIVIAQEIFYSMRRSEGQIVLMKHILDLFCRCSGQKVSEAKTRIFFSKNVDGQVRRRICEVAGYQATDDLGKYLGVPILHHHVNRQSFRFILDKVDKRLSSWKAKTHSFTGRVTLTKSVLQALPTYVMQSAYLPRHICDKIDKRCRRFVWGDVDEERYIHMINWQ